MKKIGYFRITGRAEQTVSFAEAYMRGADYLESLRRMVHKGDISLFCACNEENCLPLTITANNVIRVASNNQQEQHLESCPKSMFYSTYIAENEENGQNGFVVNEDTGITFNISIPTGVKSKSSSSSNSSGSEPNPDPFRKRTAIYEMCRVVNCLAFQKQGFSIRKQIKIAKEEGREPDWNYKDLEQFNRLFFGVSNDVNIKHTGDVEPLHNIMYSPKSFYCADFRHKFFIYAEIEKLHEFKEGRKWQYLTVKMPSNVSATKAVIRIESVDFQRISEDMEEAAGITYMLCGYIRHDTFKPDNEPEKHFITLIKYALLPVLQSSGLFVRAEAEEPILNKLQEKHILFMRPYIAIPEYGDLVPTILISKKNGKDIIVDVAKSSKEYEKRKSISSDTYDILVLNKEYGVEEAFSEIMKRLKKREGGQ